MSNNLSRRSFLKGSAVAALGVASMALPNMRAFADDNYTYADTIAWDGEYDVLVMGFGCAGAVAANYAAKSGATVLLFDVAEKGYEGGNTRYCMQVCACGEDKEALLNYYRDLNKGFDYNDEILKVFTEGLTQVVDMFVNDYGMTEHVFLRGVPAVAWALPEYPDAKDSSSINAFLVHKGTFDGALWNMVRTQAVSNDNVDVLYEARGRHLIQDPETKTILGVTIEKDGKMINIRARDGVVMSCGGFENNPKMVRNYLSLTNINPFGSLYNRGDGIDMALEVNADLWHMGSYESGSSLGGLCLDLGDGVRASAVMMGAGSYFVVGSNGQRYLNESYTARHGRIPYYGNFQMPLHPAKSYLIMDNAMMEVMTNKGVVTDSMKSVMTEAGSFAELAEKLGLTLLEKTVEVYNHYAETGEDREFFRDANTMVPVTDGTCYAIRMVPGILNTQGGARRNEKAEVIDVNGNAIPHLYSAGEFGGMTPKYYQGATNIAEAIIFGRIAGINAAAKKEPLPTLKKREVVQSNPLYIPGCSEENEQITFETSENEYVGYGTGIGGDVVVKCRIESGEIQSVEILAHAETEGIGTPAIDAMPAKFIGCSTAEEIEAIDCVSGATTTSKALKAAVIDCLTQAAK